jgi:hypothetical protein
MGHFSDPQIGNEILLQDPGDPSTFSDLSTEATGSSLAHGFSSADLERRTGPSCNNNK